MKKTLIFALFVLGICAFAFTDDLSSLFNKNITKQELNTLQSGQILIRKLSNINKSVLKTNSKTESIIKEIKDRNPNYLAEIICVIPKSKCPNLIEQVETTILDFDSYTKIPYYSEYNDLWVNLYESATLNSKKQDKDTTKLNYTVYMRPFEYITLDAQLTVQPNYLSFYTINTTTAVWDRSSLVSIKPKKMYSAISVYEDSDYYVLFGVGSLNAPSIIFLRDRLDMAFLGRIKYFTKYVFEQIQLF